MANKNKAAAPAAKKEEKKAAPKVQAPTVKKNEPKVPAATVEAYDSQLNSMKGMSQDAKVTYIDVIQRHYFDKPPVEGVKYTPEFKVGMNRIFDAFVLDIAISEVSNKDTVFAFLMDRIPDSYEAFKAVAKDMNIPLPALDSIKKSGDKLLISIAPENIPTQVKEEAKKEAKLIEEKPELDVNNIVGKDDEEDLLKKALAYLATLHEGSLFQRILNVINLYKDFSYTKYKKDEKKIAEFNNYTMGMWLDATFEKISPTILVKSIGRGMCGVTAAEKSPIHAFCILKNAASSVKDKESIPCDEDLAVMAKSIVKWIADTEIKALEGKNDKEAKSSTEMYKSALEIMSNPSFDVVDKLIENIASGEDVANKIRKAVMVAYYPTTPNKKTYKNLYQNVKEYAGVITNYFRDPLSKNIAYSAANITELEEYTQEEMIAINKENMKRKQAEQQTKEEKEEKKD